MAGTPVSYTHLDVSKRQEQYRQVTAMTVMEETMNQEQSIQQRVSPKIRCMMHFLQLMQLEQRNW